MKASDWLLSWVNQSEVSKIQQSLPKRQKYDLTKDFLKYFIFNRIFFNFCRFGYSPLHLAALNEYSYCANMLLAYGADITARTNGGTSALAMIVRKIPNVLPKFEDMLDHAITLAEHDINDVDCELKLDFRY